MPGDTHGAMPPPPPPPQWSARSVTTRVTLNTMPTGNVAEVDSATVNRAALDAGEVVADPAMSAKLHALSGMVDGNTQQLSSEATKLSSMAALDRLVKVPLGDDFVSTMINAGAS